MGLKSTAVFPDEEELTMALEEHVKLNADAAMRLRMEARERDRIEEIIKHSAAIKEGRKAEKLEIARKLKAEGMTANLIQKITGLSEADLDNL